ncbi:hypothetical protein MKX01_034158, partial [Papaver californicum]
MGRKIGGLNINPRKLGTLSKPCMKEMMTPLNCLATSGNNVISVLSIRTSCILVRIP